MSLLSRPAAPTDARPSDGSSASGRIGSSRPARTMGYQPGLDGVRAISVVAVIFYHGGFEWMHGGFLGVEVFFVVSGFLITTLLVEERERTGGVSLAAFWSRRARRLFPALFAMLFAVAAATAVFGNAEQAAELKRDLPWSIFYVNNWSQILGEVPYFQSDSPPLLRHLWSLAVEEQWYLLWPLAFGLLFARRRPDQVVRWLLGAVVVVAAIMWWVQRGAPEPMGGTVPLLEGVDRVNFNYLSTITRSGGLLLGAAMAFVWRPWRSDRRPRVESLHLDIAAGLALGVLVCSFIGARLTAGYMYPWLLIVVSLASLVMVLVVVHPAAAGTRWLLSTPGLVAVGKRSYGWYLWHWPIFVFLGATVGSWPRFVAALAISLIVAELSYRYVEEPIRRGELTRWWRRRRHLPLLPLATTAVLVLGLVAYYRSVEPYDPAVGPDEVTFELDPVVPADQVDTAAPPVAAPAEASAPPAQGTTPVPSVEPIAVSLVGDSQAHSLAVNQPEGIEAAATISDHSLDGCSVFDHGSVRSSLASFSNSFAALCSEWVEAWDRAAVDADVALVVLGAWDVFDLEQDEGTYIWGTPEWDALFTANLQRGLDAMTDTAGHLALLEIACMRPVSAEDAGVPPLPERGDDARVAHVNGLLRSVADQRVDTSFVEGPDVWCTDESIATDTALRWDGVHVYGEGAKLIFELVLPELRRLVAS